MQKAFRISALLVAASLLLILFVGAPTPGEFSDTASEVLDSALSGGETTVFSTSRDAFAKPAANLPTKKLREFAFGNKMFNTNWVQAPASVTSLDGLGPTFNRVSCSGCHFKDGRGKPPNSPEERMTSMLVRLSVPGRAEDGGPKPHPAYGGQLNNRAIHGVSAEGRAHIEYEQISGSYPDGTKYSLQKPHYRFSELAFGPLGKETMFSPRVAPAVHGLGLLEAIAESTLLAHSDSKDRNGDGISGRPNYVLSLDGKKVIGRFGWKANVASLKQQNAGAALGDIGITTSVNLKENCPPPQTDCKNAVHGGSPEMSDEQLRKLIFYTQTLAVPARRGIGESSGVSDGAGLFSKIGCHLCHTPSLKTGPHEVKQLAYQAIQPFSDLLLHDMGPELADNRPDYEASGSEWRTPPLWGIGLVKIVNKHSNFLHDGRARNLEEAILWHGGEGEASKQKFMHLSKADREALIKFLRSL